MAEKVNPYEAPRSSYELRRSWLDRLLGILHSKADLRYYWDEASHRDFLRGRPIVYEGVVFFVDSKDGSTLHAAIALREDDPSLIERCVAEVRRLMNPFLHQFPNLEADVLRRNLVVRFINSYADLKSEVTQRRAIGSIEAWLKQYNGAVQDSTPTETDGSISSTLIHRVEGEKRETES